MSELAHESPRSTRAAGALDVSYTRLRIFREIGTCAADGCAGCPEQSRSREAPMLTLLQGDRFCCTDRRKEEHTRRRSRHREADTGTAGRTGRYSVRDCQGSARAFFMDKDCVLCVKGREGHCAVAPLSMVPAILRHTHGSHPARDYAMNCACDKIRNSY